MNTTQTAALPALRHETVDYHFVNGEKVPGGIANSAKSRQLARIDYTVQDRKGRTTRKSKYVPADKVAREREKLADKGAFSFDVRW